MREKKITYEQRRNLISLGKGSILLDERWQREILYSMNAKRSGEMKDWFVN